MSIQRVHTYPQNDQAFKVVFQKKKKEKVAFPPRCKQMATIHGYSCFHITFYRIYLEKEIRNIAPV